MTMKCPNNNNHNEFLTSAHVMEEWKVDANGDWIETIECIQTVHEPNEDNTWECWVCGAFAVRDESE